MPSRTTIAAIAALALLGGCAQAAIPTATGPSRASLAYLDAGTSGGLADDLAAHPSVQLSRPGAFAMSDAARPFLAALEAVVEPQREALAARLKADATVTAGLAGWARLDEAGRLALLRRVLAIGAEAMGCQVPSLTSLAADPDEPGLYAAYTAKRPVGEIVLYMTPIARGGAPVAISALVHELRHAAQDQLAASAAAQPAGSQAAILARAYAEAFDVVQAGGGEDALAYGDYVHLNIEFDAFQTGNQVAAMVAPTAAARTQLGFVDVKYGTDLAPVFDLQAAATQYEGAALFTAVNRSQFQAQRTAGPVAGTTERVRFPGGTGVGRRRGF